MRQYLFFILFLVLLPSTLALSFSSGPTISFDGGNVTTTDPFTCTFTPQGTGSLEANVTWYRDGVSYTDDDQTIAATAGSPEESIPVNTASTAKDETWRCQVTLGNGTTSIASNSSQLTIINSKPDIDIPAQLIYFEDTLVSFTFTASDDDSDTITWTSLDIDRGSYGNEELFIIESDGDVTINEDSEDLVGNHTMQISAFDEETTGSTILIEFQLIAVNDAPILDAGSLEYNCTEGELCSGQITATDEDNLSGELSYNFNVSFINASSDGSFTFIPSFAEAVLENYTIEVNVTDGENIVSGLMDLTLETVNQMPNVTFSNTTGTQGDASFIYYVNATDTIDTQDYFNFSITSACANSPWNITNQSNGLGGNVAVGVINTSLLSNAYVACRNVTITIYEFSSISGLPKDTYVYDLVLNITNVNDAPVIAELNANEVQPNMSAQTGALGLQYSYTVNASDVDTLTYEGDTLTFSLGNVPMAGGGPLFTINNATGEITSVSSAMNASYAGEQNFTVRVTDSLSPQLNDSRNISITISLNVVPQLNTLDPTPCQDNFTCTKTLSGNDTEGFALTLDLVNLSILRPSNTTDTYTNTTLIANLLGMNVSDGTQLVNTTSFLINFTADDEDLGNYTLFYGMTDIVGARTQGSAQFFVNNTFEAPLFDNNDVHSIIDPVSITNFLETVEYTKRFYFVDDDLLYSNDTLNFTWSLNETLPGFNISQVNNSYATFTYTPSNIQSGDYILNITLTDSFNLSTTESIAFSIIDTSAFPIITEVMPYNSGATQFNASFSAVAVSEAQTNVSAYENETFTFDLRAVDGDNLSMNVTWLVNGIVNTTIAYDAGSPNHELSRSFGFFDAGEYNITAVVADIGSDSFTWNVTVLDVNRPPVLQNSLRNLTGASAIQGSAAVLFDNFFSLTSDLNIVFYDPDDDEDGDGRIDLVNETNNMTFTINQSGTCDELAVFTFNETDDDLVVTPTGSGTCSTTFVATDSASASVTSNSINIQIVQTESSSSDSSSTSSRTRTITETVTIPVEDPVDDPEEFDIIEPGITVLYENNTAIIPLTIRNTWGDAITGINLGVNSTEEQFSYVFGQQYFAELVEDEFFETNITITGFRTLSPFSFNVTAFVGSLQYTDYETININALEKGQEDVEAIKSRIGFARDLLTDNPECGELLEVLDEAEENPQDSSLQIINNVINGCKYLIGENTARDDAFPKSFTGRLSLYAKTVIDYQLLGYVLGALLGMSLVIGLVIRFTMKRI